MLIPSLAAVGFVAPWMAWGAVAAVGLPLLAHLLSKTRYRQVVFPATRLVRQAIAATSRIETPRHRLLMLLRWLVLLLIVLAFMRPQWSPQAKASGQDEGIALFLLVDASASMTRTADGATLFDRALRDAERLISQLDPSRDTAAVISVNHAPATLLPESTAQFSLLSERLQATQPGYTHANWAGAVAAVQRLARDEKRAIHVVTLSDQQGEPPTFTTLRDGRPDLRIDHIRIEGPTDNAAVRLLDVRPYPAILGRPITATVEVQNFGDQPLAANLTAEYAGKQSKQPLSLAPGTTQRVELRLPGFAVQDALLRVTLDNPDAIEADNATGVWQPVQSQTRMLIVHDADRASRTLADRLSRLFNPGEVAEQTLPSVETVTVDHAAASIGSADPAVLRTVVLLNRSPLPDAASRQLERFAQSGGGVVRFVSNDSANPASTTAAAGINFELEPLRVFEGPARAGLASLQWPGVGNTPIDERASAILIDDLERVIIAEMPRGRGRLIVINAALRVEPGGLLAEPAFVVLMNELCRYASPGPALPEPAWPGDAIPASLFNAGRYVPAPGADADAVAYTLPGAYAAMGADGLVRELEFVQLDSSESDTSTPGVWSATDPGGTPASAASQGAAATTLRDNPIELWPYLVMGVLGLAACESLLLWRFAGPTSTQAQRGAA